MNCSVDTGKDCTVCEKRKIITEFYKKGERRDSCCKTCKLQMKKEFYNREKKKHQLINKKVMTWTSREMLTVSIDMEILKLGLWKNYSPTFQEMRNISIKIVREREENVRDIIKVLL